MFPPAPNPDTERTGSPELTAITVSPQLETDSEADLSRLKEWHAESYIVGRKWVGDNEGLIVFLVLAGLMLAGFILFLTACATGIITG